jgi:hypothetical protein
LFIYPEKKVRSEGDVMETKEIKAKISQTNNKGSLTIRLYLTKAQRQNFLLEKGEQPTGMIKTIVTEIGR